MENKRIEYTNGEIVVVWQPHLCTHSGICVKTLPAVYKPQERPWVKLENSTTDKIVEQVEKCPSGALTWRKA
ncbi:(4Fe-4S)-binding protein [Alistipes sp.]|uniref:(4Fe-4S)-binding protein n=1 Tax=Alistipes sp. TaxID=1872444 RepID=UPI003AF92B16